MKPTTDQRIGTVLGGTWRLDDLIGTGGMASVYAATHQRNKLRVAVKILHPELGKNEPIRQRFLREGYLANRIQHPGVVQVLDDGVDGEHVYLVMELLRGETLKEIWQKRSRAVPAVEVESLVARVLEVLIAAHDAGVVHRDLKPDNVFLQEGGTIKLLDFGIARLHEEQALAEHATATGTMLGTPAFMPPEQALGRWDQVDGRSDLFAVGATAWLLLTGRLVQDAKSIPELLVATATKAARPLRSIAPEVPEHLARVIDGALAFSRDDRWRDARTMLEALRAGAAAATAPAAPGPAAARPQVATTAMRAVAEPSTRFLPDPRSSRAPAGAAQQEPAGPRPVPTMVLSQQPGEGPAETVKLDVSSSYPAVGSPLGAEPAWPSRVGLLGGGAASSTMSSYSATTATPAGYGTPPPNPPPDPRGMITHGPVTADQATLPRRPARNVVIAGAVAGGLVLAAACVAIAARWSDDPSSTDVASRADTAAPVTSSAPPSSAMVTPPVPAASNVDVAPAAPVSAAVPSASADPPAAASAPSAAPSASSAPTSASAPPPRPAPEYRTVCSGMDLEGNRICKKVRVR